jgi:hypothetical protein
VVDEADAREERTRSLSSRLTVYFIFTMWLFTGYGYGLVLRELVEHWPRWAREIWRPARTGLLTEARQRVGPGPRGASARRRPLDPGGARSAPGRARCEIRTMPEGHTGGRQSVRPRSRNGTWPLVPTDTLVRTGLVQPR